MALFEASFGCFNKDISRDSSASFLTIRNDQRMLNNTLVLYLKRSVFAIARAVDI